MTKSWGLSAWACAIMVGISVSGLISSTAFAQTGGDDNDTESVPDAKKPPPPPPLQISGSWDGTIQDNIKGPGTISLTLTEKIGKAKATLKGTWMVSFPSTAPFGTVNDFGTVTGSVVGSVVAITLVPAKGDDVGCRNILHSDEATQQMISATFASCGHTGTVDIQPGPPPTTVFINVGDDFFFPARLTISVGQTVRWTNNGHESHTIDANPSHEKCKPSSPEAFDSQMINQGDTYERTFSNPGTFPYHCEIHGCMMKGTITVN
jgi:plastocyanin